MKLLLLVFLFIGCEQATKVDIPGPVAPDFVPLASYTNTLPGDWKCEVQYSRYTISGGRVSWDWQPLPTDMRVSGNRVWFATCPTFPNTPGLVDSMLFSGVISGDRITGWTCESRLSMHGGFHHSETIPASYVRTR
jgi:hypothetical protein